MSPHLSRAARWLAQSGIQQPGGGVARYYRADLDRNHAISTEITGYAASAFAYLHRETGDTQYLDRAIAAAQFLTREAWDPHLRAMPFEIDPAAFSYFFDCGIIVRGLLAVWRPTQTAEFLDVAAAIGEAMLRDFEPSATGLMPIVSLPEKSPVSIDAQRWSRSPGCYQLKSAMAWRDLADVTGAASFREAYDRTLDAALACHREFLPGHPDAIKVVDRLHAYLYFLEGLLPNAGDPRCTAAMSEGIARVATHVNDRAADFARTDVIAQLLRIRLCAAAAAMTPLDCEAAAREAATLATLQATSDDPRIDGGFYFGRRDGAHVPHVSPVSSAFALQALALWERGPRIAPNELI